MDFDNWCNEKVCLQKTTGEKYDDIYVHLQDNFILLPDTSIPVDEGDKFIRTLPHGKQEVYEVINPTYYGESIGGIEPHYQIDVKKILKNNKESKSQDLGPTIHVSGNNSPVTINSNDNLINVSISGINDENIFEELRKYISKEVSIENKIELLSSVDDLEKTKGTPGYINAFKSFMQAAKDCVGVISPFLPYISDYLK